ncbi:bifunctional folylpolyglutamate synthase/dihydrofolate synthase [bacterium]|nr:bifunctional folylpolyglutamate synthase/dihydrofolate synthase [bacterium]
MDKTYKDALNLLTSQGKFRIKLGLERISKILNLLGNPQKKLKCVHVAGTNGKGSVCAMLSTILTEAGYKTGLFTSPHIFKYTERIKIDGNEISDDIFAEKIFKIQDLAKQNEIDLTEFEILTAVMFEYFVENGVDITVIEVGLGGRYDSTNVIENPICSIITTIDLDHTERLGGSIEKIAREKAGIIKPNCPVIVHSSNKGLDVIKSHCKENQLTVVNTMNLMFGEMSLKGYHQQENLSLVLSALQFIIPDIKVTTLQNALKKVEHFGRFQYFENKKVLIDGAHNPNGISTLRKNLDIYFKDCKKRFIFGCLRNKDYKKMIEILFNSEDEIYFNHFNHTNSATYEELSSVCKYPSKEYFGELSKDFDGVTIICGSLYMISELKDLFFDF